MRSSRRDHALDTPGPRAQAQGQGKRNNRGHVERRSRQHPWPTSPLAKMCMGGAQREELALRRRAAAITLGETRVKPHGLAV